MKPQYTAPEMTIVQFTSEDILVISVNREEVGALYEVPFDSPDPSPAKY